MRKCCGDFSFDVVLVTWTLTAQLMSRLYWTSSTEKKKLFSMCRCSWILVELWNQMSDAPIWQLVNSVVQLERGLRGFLSFTAKMAEVHTDARKFQQLGKDKHLKYFNQSQAGNL